MDKAEPASLSHTAYMMVRAFVKTGWKRRGGQLMNDYSLSQRVRYGWGMARCVQFLLRGQYKLHYSEGWSDGADHIAARIREGE